MWVALGEEVTREGGMKRQTVIRERAGSLSLTEQAQLSLTAIGHAAVRAACERGHYRVTPTTASLPLRPQPLPLPLSLSLSL